MTEFEPTVSVVIPAYNAEDLLGDCLASVRRIDYPAERLEVLVIDNNSRDRTRDVARDHGFEPIVCERPGASAARNTGIQHARGEVVAFTDADTAVEPDWVRELVRPLSDPEVGGVGGRIAPYRMETGSELHAAYSGMLDQERHLEGAPPHVLPFAATANAAYRTSILREIGGFDETLAVCEDADLSWRMQWAGYRMVYESRALIHHKFRPTRREYLKQTYQYGKSTVDLFAKHHRRLGLRYWIEWRQFGFMLWALARLPIAPIFASTGWEKVAPLYDLAGCGAWLAGRVVQALRRKKLVI